MNAGEITARRPKNAIVILLDSLNRHMLGAYGGREFATPNLDSFARRDAAKAIEVWTRDQDVDRLYTSLFRELIVYMMENPVTVTFGIHLLFCTKNLERMGDHATNIAEAVHYMVKGETLLRERPKADFTSMLAVSMGRR